MKKCSGNVHLAALDGAGDGFARKIRFRAGGNSSGRRGKTIRREKNG